MEQRNVIIKNKFKEKYKSGYMLLTKEVLKENFEAKEDGEILKLVDEKGNFISKAYYGIQNKGIGWVFTNKEHENMDFGFMVNKLAAAFVRRKKLYESTSTNAFRVFNAEGDGVGGVTVDYFDGYYLINWYSEGIYKYADTFIECLKSICEFKGIYQKKRFEEGGMFVEEDGFVCGEKASNPIVIKENDVNYAVYLNEGAMVGIFLDQREVRNKIKNEYAKNKTVLNTFSYTGAFSVAAACGGAKETVSVDVANRSLEKTTENFELNNIELSKQNIVVDDVFAYFKYASKKEYVFDLVVLDPPSFARTKKTKFSAAKDYTALMEDAIKITQRGGVVVASTNCSLFDMTKFKSMIDLAFKNTNRKYKILEEYSLPYDFKTTDNFKEGNYLKVLFIKAH